MLDIKGGYFNLICAKTSRSERWTQLVNWPLIIPEGFLSESFFLTESPHVCELNSCLKGLLTRHMLLALSTYNRDL